MSKKLNEKFKFINLVVYKKFEAKVFKHLFIDSIKSRISKYLLKLGYAKKHLCM